MYPEPELKIKNKNYMGMQVLKPIFQGSEDGMNYMILDVYECSEHDYLPFIERRKQFSEPHLSEKEFKKCEVCKKLGRTYQDVPDDEILC